MLLVAPPVSTPKIGDLSPENWEVDAMKKKSRADNKLRGWKHEFPTIFESSDWKIPTLKNQVLKTQRAGGTGGVGCYQIFC